MKNKKQIKTKAVEVCKTCKGDGEVCRKCNETAIYCMCYQKMNVGWEPVPCPDCTKKKGKK